MDWYCMRKKNEETVDLLLHFEVAMTLWDGAELDWTGFFDRAGLAWVMPRMLVDFLTSCWDPHGYPQIAGVWWCLWMERKDRSFEDCERTMVVPLVNCERF